MISALILNLVPGYAAERYYADALQQDGKVSLSPSFSPDGKTLYFCQSECTPIWECPQRLKVSYWREGSWSSPALVPLPVDARVDWPSVTPDGKFLLFSWSAPREAYKNLDIYENFDIYRLDLTKTNAVPEPIRGADINRPRAGKLKTLRYFHNESLAHMTRNGDLYFMTEREDGVGERDIYIAEATIKGGFKKAYPLAAPINSSSRDDGVWVRADAKVMLLNYANRGGEGGDDIFISYFTEDEWSTPLNLGDTINTEYAAFAARLSADGKHIIFNSDRPFNDQPQGLLQIWTAPLLDAILAKINDLP